MANRLWTLASASCKPFGKRSVRGAQKDNNDDLLSSILELKESEIGTKYAPILVKAGEIIGYSGITGMGIGVPTYNNWLLGKPYEVNDEEHVHFSVSALPGPESENAEQLDSFGIYGPLEKYPANDVDWSTLPGSLWLE